MIARDVLNTYVRAQPFRPFRIHVASGRSIEIRHPEMLVVRNNLALVFSSATEDAWEAVSLMLMESVSYLDAPVT